MVTLFTCIMPSMRPFPVLRVSQISWFLFRIIPNSSINDGLCSSGGFPFVYLTQVSSASACVNFAGTSVERGAVQSGSRVMNDVIFARLRCVCRRKKAWHLLQCPYPRLPLRLSLLDIWSCSSTSAHRVWLLYEWSREEWIILWAKHGCCKWKTVIFVVIIGIILFLSVDSFSAKLRTKSFRFQIQLYH